MKYETSLAFLDEPIRALLDKNILKGADRLRLKLRGCCEGGGEVPSRVLIRQYRAEGMHVSRLRRLQIAFEMGGRDHVCPDLRIAY